MTSRRLIPVVFLAISALLFGAGCSKNPAGSKDTQQQNKQSKTDGGVTINPSKGAPLFSMQEVAMHATSTDCYIVVNDKVYDATTYIKHMKDAKRIIDACGKYAPSLANDLATTASGTTALSEFEIGLVQE